MVWGNEKYLSTNKKTIKTSLFNAGIGIYLVPIIYFIKKIHEIEIRWNLELIPCHRFISINLLGISNEYINILLIYYILYTRINGKINILG